MTKRKIEKYFISVPTGRKANPVSSVCLTADNEGFCEELILTSQERAIVEMLSATEHGENIIKKIASAGMCVLKKVNHEK